MSFLKSCGARHILLYLLVKLAPTGSEDQLQCQPISIPMCRRMGYNLTAMPNSFLHDTQEEAGLEVHQYWPLVEVHCSVDLQFFLCASYAPVCVPEMSSTLPVCREVCLRARTGCEPVMESHRFAWPARLDCSQLPEYGDPNRLCMDNKNGEDDGDWSCSCRCSTPSAIPLRNGHRLKGSGVRLGSVPDCAMPCHSPFFSESQRHLAERWTLSWAAVCAVSSLITFTTFLLDRSRYPYPQRPVICLAFCYLMIAMGYGLRASAGHRRIGCDGEAVRYTSLEGQEDPVGGALCMVVFILIYFFSVAGAVWWVILSLCWFLSAALKWGNEIIAGYTMLFHSVAWSVPTLLAITAISLSAVDGDALLGVCSLGNQNDLHRRLLLLLPQILCLLVGCSFLLAGFVSLCRVRDAMKNDHNKDKLNRLMLRLGLFSMFYAVSSAIEIACHSYEQLHAEEWRMRLVCPCREEAAPGIPGPSFQLTLLRHFMSLAVGVSSVVWVFSGKTLRTWSSFCCRRRPGGVNTTAAVRATPLDRECSERTGQRATSQNTCSLIASHTGSEPARTVSSGRSRGSRVPSHL